MFAGCYVCMLVDKGYLLITEGVRATMVVTPVEDTTMVVMAVVWAAPERALVKETT